MKDRVKFFDFDNSYARLPENFYHRQMPVVVQKPRLIAFNRPLALELGAHTPLADTHKLAEIFAGNEAMEGAEPLAMAYAGHQFGHFVPQLGDGRALLLGEIMDVRGSRRDIQLKGSGKTLFSRNGDGRAALGPVMREYIVSEAMHALGIPTTRSLAVVTSGETVYRDTPLPGAILARVAASHIRIGTFQYFAARKDYASVTQLADYVIKRHYPKAEAAGNAYGALLEHILEAQAQLIASWMHIGFIHGVMNTDNSAVSGETIDYGPCAFMDHYDPEMVFSSIDRNGRYAFGNQPFIAQWNLARLAETFLPLLDTDRDNAVKKAEKTLAAFPDSFKQHWLAGMRRKLGLLSEETADIELIETLLVLMQRGKADYTLAFRLLCNENNTQFLRLFNDQPTISEWLGRWHERVARQPGSAQEPREIMRQANPAYIPRNHKIEQAIEAAVEREDFSLMERLCQALANPYQEQEEFAEYALPPSISEQVKQTFCGT